MLRRLRPWPDESQRPLMSSRAQCPQARASNHCGLASTWGPGTAGSAAAGKTCRACRPGRLRRQLGVRLSEGQSGQWRNRPTLVFRGLSQALAGWSRLLSGPSDGAGCPKTCGRPTGVGSKPKVLRPPQVRRPDCSDVFARAQSGGAKAADWPLRLYRLGRPGSGQTPHRLAGLLLPA